MSDQSSDNKQQRKVQKRQEREARKARDRGDKQLARITAREAEINAEVLEHAHDYEKLAELGAVVFSNLSPTPLPYRWEVDGDSVTITVS